MELSTGQKWVLSAAAVPMIVFGIMGGVGTYANITSVFHRSATALGVIAAGEGATLILALVMVGLTMLGQPSPKTVRVGLWAVPMMASVTCAVVAESLVEAVVFAVTPMAMVVSAEGMGLLARRIVVYRTGVDMEAQRRNSETMRQLTYHRASAAGHPTAKIREKSALKAWKLARKVGQGDPMLGASLIEVQRDGITSGADKALRELLFGQADSPDTEADKPADSPDTEADKPADSPDTEADKPADSSLVQRRNVSAFVRGLLTERPDISDADIRSRILADFGPDTEADRIRKAIKRARARVA